MALWRLAFLVALYVAIDVANPLMPGAFVFDVEASVELPGNTRSWGADEATSAAPTLARTELRAAVPVSTRLYRLTRQGPRRYVARACPPPRAQLPSGEDDPASPALALM